MLKNLGLTLNSDEFEQRNEVWKIGYRGLRSEVGKPVGTSAVTQAGI